MFENNTIFRGYQINSSGANSNQRVRRSDGPPAGRRIAKVAGDSGEEIEIVPPEILFFSRGRGRGHAIPDLEILRELRAVREDVGVWFASYGTGAETLTEAGEMVIDMGLPEDNCDFLKALTISARVVENFRPSLVVSHEEFPALPGAAFCQAPAPAVFVIDWFADPELCSMQALLHANEIVFLEREELFAPPEYVREKVCYVGPIVRRMVYTRQDRGRARLELGLPADAMVVSVIPGAWATEARAPLADTLLASFDSLSAPNKHLVWNAGEDVEEIRRRSAGRENITVIKSCNPVERLIAASDMGITKGNRGSTLDFYYIGVPSISVSYGANPVDDHFMSQIPTNTALLRQNPDAASLSSCLADAIASLSTKPPPMPVAPTGAARTAAERIAEHLEAALTGTRFKQGRK